MYEIFTIIIFENMFKNKTSDDYKFAKNIMRSEFVCSEYNNYKLFIVVIKY
jgi:hypothetical protein